jgi:hypothetical protein
MQHIMVHAPRCAVLCCDVLCILHVAAHTCRVPALNTCLLAVSCCALAPVLAGLAAERAAAVHAELAEPLPTPVVSPRCVLCAVCCVLCAADCRIDEAVERAAAVFCCVWAFTPGLLAHVAIILLAY